MLAFEPFEQLLRSFHGATRVAKIEAACSFAIEEAIVSRVAVQDEKCSFKFWQQGDTWQEMRIHG